MKTSNKNRVVGGLLALAVALMAAGAALAAPKDRPNIKRKGVITATTDLITGVNFEKRYNLVSRSIVMMRGPRCTAT